MADRFKIGDPVYVYMVDGSSFRAEVVKLPEYRGDKWIFNQITHHEPDKLVYVGQYKKIEARKRHWND